MAQHYPILPVPGSPKNIYTLFQDSKSRLWIGTEDDLLCFDGEHFYSMRPYGSPKETVRSVAEDSVGGIWAVTTNGIQYSNGEGGGIYRYDGTRFAKVSPMFTGTAPVIVSGGPGIMLAALPNQGGKIDGPIREQTLFRFHLEGSVWKPELIFSGTHGRPYADQLGSIIFGCEGGWCEFSQRQIADWPNAGTKPKHHPIPGLVDSFNPVRDRFGCIWGRGGSVGFFGCDGNKPLQRLPGAFIGYNDWDTLAPSPDGRVVSLGIGTVGYGRPGSLSLARAQNGVPSDLVVPLVGTDGTIWLGGKTGLYRFQYPFQLEYWDQQDGIEAPQTIVHAAGRMLFGATGISALDANRIRWSLEPGTEALGTMMSLIPGPEGTIYAGANGHGVSQLTADGKILATSDTQHRALSLAEDATGQLWMGGKGLYRVDRNGSVLIPVLQDFGQNSLMDFKMDSVSKTLWACNWRELLANRDGHWRLAVGPADMSGLNENFCESLVVQPNGNLWVAYGGLHQFSLIQHPASAQMKVTDYRSGGSIGDAHASFLGTDSHGWLWRGSDADYVATGPDAEQGNWLKLDQVDGIPLPGGNINAFYGDADGSVWFGSGNTVVHFNPSPDFVTKFPAPKIFLAGYSIGNDSLVLAQAFQKIPHGQELTAHIGSLQFDRRNALRLRWRLLPVQSSWQTGGSFDLPLGKLRWGSYRLQVQAQMANGPWSGVEEDAFTVLRPIWLTWPALCAFLVTMAVCAAAILRLRKKLKERASKRLPEMSSLRIEAILPELQELEGRLLDERFTVGRLIASGGFASVLEGTDLHQGGMKCAVKIFHQEIAERKPLRVHFQQEVALLEMIRHPNVVTVFGSGNVPSGSFYLAMELIQGETLRHHLDVDRMTPGQIARYLRQMGSALQAIHRHNICHRDLKPENLMIRTSAEPYKELVLIDFSIAIVKDPDASFYGATRAAGTIEYMPPEQVHGYAAPSSDIYSLSKIVIEMLTGQRLSNLLPKPSLNLPPLVRELLHGISLPVSPGSIELIASALEYLPSARPRDAYEFASQIADDLESHTHAD